MVAFSSFVEARQVPHHSHNSGCNLNSNYNVISNAMNATHNHKMKDNENTGNTVDGLMDGNNGVRNANWDNNIDLPSH